MEHKPDKRTVQTRERLQRAAYRLFLERGYLATSIDAILAEAGISSKETLYRHYANKEALFVDILSNLTMERPGFSETLLALPSPSDLPSLRHTLTLLAREILSMMTQPGYLPLIRMIIAEAPRFPELASLFFSTVTRRGLALIEAQLQAAREQHLIADLDLEVVARMLLGGLLTHVLMNLMLATEQIPPPAPEQVDAIIEVLMRALTP